MSKEKWKFYALFFACLFISGCDSGGNSGGRWSGSAGSSQEIPPPPTPTDIVLVDALEILEDGASWIHKLEEGRYELQMTASNDGATVEWIGGTCGKSAPLERTTMTCSMQGTGQIVISNPTVFFGLGSSSSVTIKLTKLAY